MAKNYNGVALFIDWENIQDSMDEQHKEDKITGDKIAEYLLQVAKSYGQLHVARAYAVWSNPNRDPLPLYKHGIEPVYVASQKEKNTTDTRLIVDALDWVRKHPHVPTVIIASGDGDMVHLHVYLRQVLHRRVIGVGIRGSSSKRLRKEGDEWVFLDEEEKLQQAFAQLRTVIHELHASAANQGFSAINRQLVAQGFNLPVLGFSQFKEFMLVAQERGIVRVEQNGFDYAAYLPEEVVDAALPISTSSEQEDDMDKAA